MSVTVRRVFNSATLPQSVEVGTSQSKGITIDNYSNFWLTVGTDGLFVPPHTLGWATNLWISSASSVIVRLGAPIGAAQNVAGNGDIIVAIYDVDIAPSPGVATTGLQGYAFTSFFGAIAALFNTNVTLNGVGGSPADTTQFWLEAVVLTFEEDAGEPLPPVNTAVGIITPGVLNTTLMITPANPVCEVDFKHFKLQSAVLPFSLRASGAGTDLEVTFIFSAM